MLTVWIHGVIEIFCIVVAGAAGMAFGNGLFFPGAWPRGVSFARGAREALKIGIGLIPFFFFAAFFEGFVTRFTAMNDISRIAIIFTTFFFVIWYFVYWPFIVTHDPRKGLSGLSASADENVSAKKNGFLERMGSGVVYLLGIAIFTDAHSCSYSHCQHQNANRFRTRYISNHHFL